MKIAYIAGPYRASSISGVYANIQRAREVAKKYWLKGYAVICPHMNTAFLDGISGAEGFQDADIFLKGDLEMIRRSDVIVMIPGWQNSAGAKGELELAQAIGLEVIYE